MKRLLVLAALSTACWADLVKDVRGSIAAKDFAAGEKLISDYRKSQGATPEMILALSWLGRGAQANKQWDQAERYAAETRKLALDALKTRKLDDENSLPLALGASIEVHAHTLAARNARIEAVAFLQAELRAWYDTSIRTRIQKNLHLLSLEGKPAPPLEMKEHLGSKPQPLSQERGKVVVLFFWAHWCSDCKRQGPVLARLQQELGPKGLVVVGPTQPYGYVAGGQDATREQELLYIQQVREKSYGSLTMAVPVSEENFRSWGCSTTPTLVLLDRQGVVRLYHPGQMSYEELAPRIATLLGS